MDPLTMALLVGFFGACIVWTVTRNIASSRMGKGPASCRAEEGDTPHESSPEELDAVYRKIFWMRVLGLVLCILAILVLYMGLNSGIAFVLALAGCLTQYASFRIRYRYLRKKHLVPEAKKTVSHTKNAS